MAFLLSAFFVENLKLKAKKMQGECNALRTKSKLKMSSN